jgi:hypothetical protein
MTIIGGQGLCLLLTLLLVPVAYVQFDGLEQAMLNGRFTEWFSRLSAAAFRRNRPEPQTR